MRTVINAFYSICDRFYVWFNERRYKVKTVAFFKNRVGWFGYWYPVELTDYTDAGSTLHTMDKVRASTQYGARRAAIVRFLETDYLDM